MKKTQYVPGDYYAVCDVCGFEFYASELKKRWDGRMVCKTDWEPRHPQETLRIRTQVPKPPWTRPEPTDVFIDYTDGFDGSTL